MIRNILNRFNKKKNGKGVVLMYHRIASEAIDPWDLCVSKENFDLQLAMLQQNFHVLPIAELLNQLKQNSLQPRSVAISFDDGYADNYLTAKSLLKKHNCFF